ncbi:DUF3310 domain-containing protein [Corynebacterium sp. 13CS0277]|uniref:DUF3310 domain-containing protein n=1 Tax=Corynebacterium sp. 13CS0277 TaxID=2071994 RepID=UPI000D0254D8|nr:DUF3310 domain-containing protein [Corynebacterium sp. 13CS0277]
MQNDETPAYYRLGDVDAGDVCERLTFWAGNAVKYLVRSSRLDGHVKGDPLTGPVEDLRKARACINRELARLGGKR